MPARTGNEFIQGLKDHPPEIWIAGERVGDVAAHPAFRNVVRSVAALYDLQHDAALRDQMTFVSPSGGERVGMSFLVPRTHNDLALLATLPLADEILVFPSTLLRGKDEDRPYAFAFAIPCSASGLKFICRETFDPGGSTFDHPLASRFEEMDAVVIFEDVIVPWERVFLLRDVERCNKAFSATGAVAHMAHQVVTKNIAKTEFLLGIASLMVDAIAIDQFQHVQSKIAEIIYYLESMRAFARASEADATLNAWGVMTPAWPPLDAARNMFTWMYPRMVEILQLLGASGMMARPTQADMESPLRPLIEKYFQAAQADAVDRIKLFRLAWDAALSSFGSRQVIYERFFFGDPVRMQMATFASYDRLPYVERVRQFLAREHALPSRS